MMQAQPTVKRSFFLFLTLVVIPFFGISQNTETPYRIKTIVIDAGHGGKDPGNLGTGRYKAKEKDIALDVALRVGSYIDKQFPEINVIYTRKTDVFIGLDGRAEVANKAKADLFISIHCNAFPNPNSNGVETFVLGLHRNKENLQVAMKENSAIFLEEDYKTRYEGFDPNSAESIIALTIMQSAYLQQSLAISSYIQNQFKNRVGRRDRGVKQAGFLVLRKTTMPSILIELGFLTHAPEEDFLNTENGKSYMSSAIFRGFKEYKETVEDPLPEGYDEPAKEPSNEKATTKEEEQAAKQAELDARMKAAEQAKLDSIKKAEDQAKIKAVADSLEQRKQQLLAEKKEREEEIAKKVEEERKAKIQAKIDSLEQVKRDKIAAFEKQKAEEEARKAKAEEERLTAELKKRKELEAKQDAKEWLEEIKEVKEQELADAKRQAEIDAEKEILEQIKLEKQQELEKARAQSATQEKAKTDSINASKLIAEQAKIDALAKQEEAEKQASLDSIFKVAEQKKEALVAKAERDKEEIARQDSVLVAEAEKAASKALQEKARQDSIAIAKAANEPTPEVTLDVKKAASAEEAELLFLQLRKKQLEQRIASLKNQDVETRTLKSLPEPAVAEQIIPDPVTAESDQPKDGLVLKVQVLTSATRLGKSSTQLKGQEAWEYQKGGLYKYTVGAADNFDEITKLQGELRNLGFKGAFVVAFKDGERIKVSEARELLKSSE
ncbi:N-acetylmuramoyl-L-alanine amidase [Flavobacteriales bacterium]|nr:N-acetylmuramoyl-L-alanine amidase [Flavobacteriales bacterium]